MITLHIDTGSFIAGIFIGMFIGIIIAILSPYKNI